MEIHPVCTEIADVFKRHCSQCYLVGGAIRDLVLNRQTDDFDIATDALATEVMDWFKKAIPTGIKHGTVTVFFKGTRFEITTFRLEGKYSDGRRPDEVKFIPSIFDDLCRRDFTINAIAYDLINGALIDPHGGIFDIRRRIIRAIDDPVARFNEDGLRPIRACRFAAQFAFHIEEVTKDGIRRTLSTVSHVSAERKRDEITKILQADKPSIGFSLLAETGLLSLLMPELQNCVGIKAENLFKSSLFSQSLRACDYIDKSRTTLRLAALLQEIGRGALDSCDEKCVDISAVDQLSAKLAQNITHRLRFSNSFQKEVYHLIAHKGFHFTNDMNEVSIRHLIAKTGKQYIKDILRLRRAHQQERIIEDFTEENYVKLLNRVDHILQSSHPLEINDLAVRGSDIIEHLGISAGPYVGHLLRTLLNKVINDPSLNCRERLLAIALSEYREHKSTER